MQPASGMQFFSRMSSGLGNATSSLWKLAPSAQTCSSIFKSVKNLGNDTIKAAKKHPKIALAAIATTGTIAAVVGGISAYKHYRKNTTKALPVEVVDGATNSTNPSTPEHKSVVGNEIKTKEAAHEQAPRPSFDAQTAQDDLSVNNLLEILQAPERSQSAPIMMLDQQENFEMPQRALSAPILPDYQEEFQTSATQQSAPISRDQQEKVEVTAITPSASILPDQQKENVAQPTSSNLPKQPQFNLESLSPITLQGALIGLVGAIQDQQKLQEQFANNNVVPAPSLAQVLAKNRQQSAQEQEQEHQLQLVQFLNTLPLINEQSQTNPQAESTSTIPQDNTVTAQQNHDNIETTMPSSSSDDESHLKKTANTHSKRNTNASVKQIQQAAQKDIQQLKMYKEAFDKRDQDGGAKFNKLLKSSLTGSLATASKDTISMASNMQKLKVAPRRYGWQDRFVNLYITAKGYIGQSTYEERTMQEMIEQLEGLASEIK